MTAHARPCYYASSVLALLFVQIFRCRWWTTFTQVSTSWMFIIQSKVMRSGYVIPPGLYILCVRIQ